jgi:hypothetical protein
MREATNKCRLLVVNLSDSHYTEFGGANVEDGVEIHFKVYISSKFLFLRL